MGKPAKLTIDIVADVAKATKGIDDIDRKLGGLGKAVTGAAILGGAAVAGKAIVDLGGAMLTAGEEGAALTRTTEQLLATTGNAASTSADYLVDYADALARQTGVSDDSIQAGQNMLLTFSAISNEVDDGTGVFDRATKAALDLAGAGFGSMESNATQLGKALQDPTKGMGALAEAGVSFTAQEQETIKALQESGDMFAAQNIILAAVEGQVEGAAAASATSSEKMQVAWQQTLETLGTALLPIVDKLLPVFTDLLDGLVPVALPIVELIADLAVNLIDALLPAIEPLIPVLVELADMLGQELATSIDLLAPLLPDITTSLADIMLAAIPLIPPLLEVNRAFTPLLPVLVELIALAAQLAVMVLPLLTPVMNAISRAAADMSYALLTATRYVSQLIDFVSRALSKVGDLLAKLGNIPGGGLLSGIGNVLPWSAASSGGAAGPSTFATGPSSRSGGSTTTLRVDVTGVGFDSVLTGRAIAKQLREWQGRNGLSPVQWADLNGGLPA